MPDSWLVQVFLCSSRLFAAIRMPSTVISSYSYDAGSRVLRIRFVSGLVYEYNDVPEAVYLKMKESKSKGIFFNREIKDKYEFQKLRAG